MNKESVWKRLPDVIDLHSQLQRHVITEKFCAEVFMRNYIFYKMDGCYLFTNSEWPNSIFYLKEDESGKNKLNILLRKNIKDRTLFLKQTDLWNFFLKNTKLCNEEIDNFLRKIFGNLFSIDNIEDYEITVTYTMPIFLGKIHHIRKHKCKKKYFKIL